MLAGGCRCGAVRYTLTVAGVPATYACHCTICQRSTGSSFAHQMPVREDAMTVTGELKLVPMPTLTGGVSVQRYCANCLTRLFNTNAAWPGVAIVRAGTVDGSETLTPAFHIYISTKQPWITLPEGSRAFEEGPPPEEWRRLLSAV